MKTKTKIQASLRMRWAEVRPEMASRWLKDANTHNRTMSPSRVAIYAADMRAGDWLQTGTPILFSETGTLLDGQHRMAAVVEADAPQTFLIIEGLTKSVQLVIDGAKTRTDSDKLKLGKGMDVTPKVVAVARSMMRPLHVVTSASRHGRKPTTCELAQFATRHAKALSFACGLFARKGIGVTQAAVPAVVARAWYTQDHHRLTEFAAVLYSGINRGEKDIAAIRLRDALTEGLATRGTKAYGAFYGKLEFALNAFVGGDPVPRLSVAKEEMFPLPEETAAGSTTHHGNGRIAALVGSD